MKTEKNPIQKEIEKIWPNAQKDLSKINKEAKQFFRKGEKRNEKEGGLSYAKSNY